MSTDCQLSNFGAFNQSAFTSVACAQCFSFIYLISETYRDVYRSEVCPGNGGLLVCRRKDPSEECNCDNPNRVFNDPRFAINNRTVRPFSELRLSPELPSGYVETVASCCRAARHCCVRTQQQAKQQENTSCSATWDGWQCFGAASPGVITAACPDYIYGDHIGTDRNIAGRAEKVCLDDGWRIVNTTGYYGEWTDYKQCAVPEPPMRLAAGIVAYTISILAIVPALIIICLFRSLRSQSVFVIHRHLLISFLLSAVFFIFTSYFLFGIWEAPPTTFLTTNHVWCSILMSIQLRYLRLTNFSWMLAEGVYLFRLLCNSFSDSDSLAVYKLVCWGVPAILTTIYCILRLFDNSDGCWLKDSTTVYVNWIISFSCLICICVNLLLVTVILYILVKKLRYNPHLEPVQYRKAVRAAMMLVPVFGLHFFFTVYRMESHIHQTVNMVLEGLQGFAVSIILCYANTGVMECLKKWIRGFKENQILKKEVRSHSQSGMAGRIQPSKKISYAGTETVVTQAENNNCAMPLIPTNHSNASSS